MGALAGYAYSYRIDKHAAYIFCDTFPGGADCVTVSKAEFQTISDPIAGEFVITERPGAKYPMVMAPARTVEGEIVEIGSAYKPSAGGYYTPGDEFGPNVSINFSTKRRVNRYNQITCWQLDITKAASGIFIANGCSNPAVGVLHGMEFRVQDEDKLMLDRLVNAVLEETSAEDARRLGQFVLITPIFVFLFLVVSGLIWLFRRAKAYVLAA